MSSRTKLYKAPHSVQGSFCHQPEVGLILKKNVLRLRLKVVPFVIVNTPPMYVFIDRIY